MCEWERSSAHTERNSTNSRYPRSSCTPRRARLTCRGRVCTLPQQDAAQDVAREQWAVLSAPFGRKPAAAGLLSTLPKRASVASLLWPAALAYLLSLSVPQVGPSSWNQVRAPGLSTPRGQTLSVPRCARRQRGFGSVPSSWLGRQKTRSLVLFRV